MKGVVKIAILNLIKALKVAGEEHNKIKHTF